MKKTFAVLMIAMMCVCFMPTAAFADADEEAVAMIGEVTYTTLDEAVEKATDGETIHLLKDCTTAGLNLNKNLTIDGSTGEGEENNRTITFNDKGIALWGKNLTFNNCTVNMTGIGSTPYTAEWHWMAICASTGASLTLDNTVMTMDGTGTKNEGNKATHAIYFCSNNKLNLNNSTLTIKNYPQDALEWDGGDGGYNVNMVNSTFVSDNNRSGFTGTFYATIDNSKVDVINSTGNGSNGSHFDIKNGSVVNFNNNNAHGLSARMLTIDNSTVNAIGNGANGIHTTGKLEIKNNSKVSVSGNRCSISSQWTIPGAVYVGGADSFIDDTCKVEITDNKGSGILVRPNASLDVKTGTVIRNTAEKLGMGGGINNSGTVNLSDDVQLYNNHAAIAGDDIYNAEGASITFGSTGSGWKLDGEPDCTDDITGWFDDSENNRWKAHGDEPLHMEEFSVKGQATVTELKALKAAHGKITPYIPPTYYTVTYNDGVDGEIVFPDQVNSGLSYWTLTPEFKGVPTREGYVFKGWTPVVAERVTGNAYYKAVWEKAEEPAQPTEPTKPDKPTKPEKPTKPDKPNKPNKQDRPDTEVPKTGDVSFEILLASILALALSATAGLIVTFRKKASTKK